MAQSPLDITLWVVIAASWTFLMVRTDWNLLEIGVWSVPFLLMTTAVSTPWRTVRWRTLLGFFMLGMGPVFLLAALIGWGLDATGVEDTMQRWLSGTGLGISDVRADVIAPISEEFLKVLPLLVYFWWRKSGLRSSGGPLDFAVLAGATGAGLAFGEDIFVYLSQGSLGGPPSSLFGLGLGQIYANLVGARSGGFIFTGRSDFADNLSFFFPEMQELLGVVWSGHGALALGIGLSLGLALWLSRRRGTKVFFLLPVVVYVWAVWEHVMANWYGGSGCFGGRTSVLCTLTSIDLHGRIFPLMILAAWGYSMWVSGRQLREHRSEDSLLALLRSEVKVGAYTSLGLKGWSRLPKDWFDFLRWRRKVGYGAFHLAFTKPNSVGQVSSLMASRVKTMMLKEHLQGTSPTSISEATLADIDWLAPAP